MDKILNLLKDKNISIPRILLLNYKKLRLNESELIIIIFLVLNLLDVEVNAIEDVKKDFESSILPCLEEFVRLDNLSPDYDQDWETNGKAEKE